MPLFRLSGCGSGAGGEFLDGLGSNLGRAIRRILHVGVGLKSESYDVYDRRLRCAKDALGGGGELH